MSSSNKLSTAAKVGIAAAAAAAVGAAAWYLLTDNEDVSAHTRTHTLSLAVAVARFGCFVSCCFSLFLRRTNGLCVCLCVEC